MSATSEGTEEIERLPIAEHVYKNVMGQYTALTEEVLYKEWGQNWKSLRVAKTRLSWDFSDSTLYALETLEGPKQGLMMKDLQSGREFVESLNISKNRLTEIDCLNRQDAQGRYEFRRLQILVAARNQLTECHLQLPTLLELNLSRNQLVLLPDCSGMPALTTLILNHNRIDGLLKDSIRYNGKLRKLDLSGNQFSWKPTVFKEQLDLLSSGSQFYITSLKLWPNPFAEHFKEYQFLAVAQLESLVELDGFTVDQELRNELRTHKEQLLPNVDYTRFDVQVEQKHKNLSIGHEAETRVDAGKIPTIEDLTNVLQKPLDFPDQLVQRIQEFDTLVSYVWGASVADRRLLLKIGGRHTSEATLHNWVNEFIDKMTMVLQRFDSAQEVLVRGLVRLCASGYAPLSKRCATALAEWVEQLPPETKANLRVVAGPLFKELRLKMIRGLQSIAESPKACYLASQAKPGMEPVELEGLSGTVEEIEECADILNALSTFSLPSYARKAQPLRALALLPFLPALCRMTRVERGPDELKTDDWTEYTDFSSCMDEANPDDTLEVQWDSFYIFKEKCVAKSFGGFICEPVPERPGFARAHFIPQLPEVLVGLRRRAPGKRLFIRPISKPDAPPKPDPNAKVRTWEVWSSGLSILTLATDMPENAAVCVKEYKIHEIVLSHITTHFTDTWVLVSNDAMDALVLLLLLSVNLMRASGEAGRQAKEYFTERKLHEDAFRRIRRRLTENGTALELKVLKSQTKTFCALISALVSVVSEMAVGRESRMRGDHLEPVPRVMEPLKGPTQIEAFYMLVDIVADTETPDPLLLAAALEAIWFYIESSITRQAVIGRVLGKLHDSAVLLTFILGPHLKDGTPNAKYEELWRKCEKRYSMDPERIMANEEQDELDENTRGPDAPELKDLMHPLMHRVLLGVVALIEQFSRKAKDDQTGGLRNATDLLDKNNREELLIGPAGGLVLVPDWDVKIECIKSIKHVLYVNAAQFEQQEMGWLLRYLNSTGIGMGNQEVFLKHVLDLIIVLVTDETKTGHRFRQQFAKAAIRESFDMLRVNSHRDLASSPEAEEHKLMLSQVIVTFLNICSRPYSGSLRPFLRRVDLLEKLRDTVLSEDRHEKKSVRGRLLATWTGRDMREVLLPLATGNELSLYRMARYRALVRTADVLQGKPDYRELASEEDHAEAVDGEDAAQPLSSSSRFVPVLSTDETKMWRGLYHMRKLAFSQDDIRREDFHKQQMEFAFLDGYRQLMEFGERFFRELDQVRWPMANKLHREWLVAAEKAVKAWTTPGAFAGSLDDRGRNSLVDAEEIGSQVLNFLSEGSRHIVDDISSEVGGPSKKELEEEEQQIEKKDREHKQELLLRAYMDVSNIRRAAPEGHGEFRRLPLDFKNVAEKVLGTAMVGTPQNIKKVASILDESATPNLMFSAAFRCFYVAIEVSVVPELKCMAIDEIMGQVEDAGELSRFLQLCVAAVLSPEGELEESRLVRCSVAAKALRMLSSVLTWAPETGDPAMASSAHGEDFEDTRDEAYHKKRAKAKDSDKDAHRLKVLCMLSSYLQFLAKPLHQRLSIVAQRELDHSELLLLKEYVTVVDRLLRVLFCNELRVDSKSDPHSAKNMDKALQEAEKEVEAVRNGSKARGSFQMKLFHIFSRLCSKLICRVLVQIYLYAIHREAKMFEQSHALGEHDAKTISSLAQRAVGVLAVVMYGGAEQDTDYNICEAISHAMTTHVQVVPRPRVMQLMREWRTEYLRNAVQAEIDLRDARSAKYSDASHEPIGKIIQLGLAYVFREQEVGSGALRLLVITSRLRLLVVDPGPVAHGQSSASSSFQSAGIKILDPHPPYLHSIKRVYAHPRMRQFLAVSWKKQRGQQEAQKEMWIFESSSRRSIFWDLLHLPKPDLKWAALSGEVESNLIQVASKGHSSKLVSISFIKTSAIMSTDIMEVLIMTRDVISTISISDFVHLIFDKWAPEVDDKEKDDEGPVLIDDSDSDNENLPEPMVDNSKDSEPPSFYVRQGPYNIDSLPGVRFLADAEPTVVLHTDRGEVPIVFFSDGDRKRFRQQLNAVLSRPSPEEEGQDKGKKLDWSVVASAEKELKKVQLPSTALVPVH